MTVCSRVEILIKEAPPCMQGTQPANETAGGALLRAAVLRHLVQEGSLPVKRLPIMWHIEDKIKLFRNSEFPADHRLLQEVIADYHITKLAREYLIL